MKRQHLASMLSIVALIAGGVCTSAQAVTFTPPTTNRAPSQATGGASRGSFFIPPADQGAPNQATGGASRGGLFVPADGQRAPRQAMGGASRGGLFTPADGQRAPQHAAGGASRGDLFTPADSQRAPQQAAGGASRVGTYYLNPSMVGADGPAAMIALTPQSYYGTTVSERPMFLVYLPASNAAEAVFSLKDAAGNLQYQMTVPVAGAVGVVPIQLPEDAPALEIGEDYQWLVALKVDGQLGPSTPYVDGWIQRIQPNDELATALQEGDALEQATALGQNGVWYDCVAILASLYATEAADTTLTHQWAELLSSVGLEAIETAPVLASVQ